LRRAGGSTRGEEEDASASESRRQVRDPGGKNPKEVSVGHLAKPQGLGRDLRGVKTLKASGARRRPQGRFCRVSQRQEGSGARKGVRRCGGSKTSKGEPQGRERDEIGPTGQGGSKASRGCETLRAQQNRVVWEPPGKWLLLAGKTSKGRKTSEGASSSKDSFRRVKRAERTAHW